MSFPPRGEETYFEDAGSQPGGTQGRVPWQDGAQGLMPVFGRDLRWGWMVGGAVVRGG